MRRPITTAFFMAMGFVTPAAAGEGAAVTAGIAFCGFVQNEATYARHNLVTPTLNRIIDKALAQNDAIQALAPDEKPPLGDGIPWSSWPDRPDACTIDLLPSTGAQVELAATYTFGGAPEATYTDTLVMRLEGTWRVDDIRYVDGSTLRAALTEAFPH